MGWAGQGEVPVCRHLRKGRDQREAEGEMAEPGKAEAGTTCESRRESELGDREGEEKMR